MKKVYMQLMALLLAAALCGCAVPAATAPVQGAESRPDPYSTEAARAISQAISEYNSSRGVQQEAEEAEPDPCAPLPVSSHASSLGDCYVIYPQVQDAEAADAMNQEICRQVKQRADELGLPVFTEYRVEYNRNGIFSVRIFLYDLYGQGGECLDCIPITFDAGTGEVCSIDDFFGEDNRWRGSIPDMITAQAEDEEMVLLNDLMPISNDQQFYITDDSVVIMYDLYEISVYSAGEPEFQIPVGELAEYIGDGSPLNVFLSPSPEPQLAAEAAASPSAEPTAELTPDPIPSATPAPAGAVEPSASPEPTPAPGEPERTPAQEASQEPAPSPAATPTPVPAGTALPAEPAPVPGAAVAVALTPAPENGEAAG